MIYPNTTLSKVYYYIANTVVYDISNKYIKDNDNCAINPIVYTNKDKNEVNEIETAKIFPCFTVTYKKKNKEDNIWNNNVILQLNFIEL